MALKRALAVAALAGLATAGEPAADVDAHANQTVVAPSPNTASADLQASLRGASGQSFTSFVAAGAGCTAKYTDNCKGNPTCCDAGFTCYEKDQYWAACRDQACIPNAAQPGDSNSLPWTCTVLGGGSGAGGPSGSVPSPSPSPAQSPSCTNQNEMCAAWAERGECSKNPDYMNIMCQQSCGVCQ